MSDLTTRARKRADRCDAKYADGTGALLRELSDEIEHVVSIARAHAELAEKRLEWNQGLRAEIKRLSERAALVDELRKSGRAVLEDMQALIGDSEGVAGLHLNGDIAPWDTLLTGGEYEQWLMSLDEFETALARADAARGGGG